MKPRHIDPAHSEEELSAEEVRGLRRRHLLRRTAIFAVPALALLGVMVAVLMPLLKDWRARQFAADADRLREQGKLQDAFNNASSAMQMRPGLPEVKRSYARVLFAAKEPAGLQVMQQLIDAGQATTDDRIEVAEAALRLGDVPLAEREAFHLIQQSQGTARALHVLARVRLAQQRVPDALQALEESVEEGGGPDPAILLAGLRIADGTSESLESAVTLLRPIARQTDRAGLEALLVLLASPAVKSDEGQGWIEALRAHPLASDEQRISAAGAEMQRDPARAAEVVRTTVAAYGRGSTEQRAALARWLNRNREYDTVLDLLTPAEASSRSDLFLIRLDAMAGKSQWEQIAGLLESDGLPLQSAIALLYRGRAARELGKSEESANLYRRAITESAPAQDMLWYVINYLQSIGEDRVVEQELKQLAQSPATARQAFAALVPIVQKRQDAEELYQLYDRMLKKLPADPVVQNDHRYFAALTGRRADIGGARELVEKEPAMLAYRITLALTQLKSGQQQAALAVFDGTTLDPAQIQPYQRAVLAAVLGANGREAEARQLARSVPSEAVTVQEFDLTAPWRENPME